jgi:hypothetical protein
MKLIVNSFEEYHGNFQPWGVICVNINDTYFPDEQWWDNSLSILEMWAYEISIFIRGYTSECNLSFMDGDYSILLVSSEINKTLAYFKDPTGEVILSSIIEPLLFAQQILLEINKIQMQPIAFINPNIRHRLKNAEIEIRESIDWFMPSYNHS